MTGISETQLLVDQMYAELRNRVGALVRDKAITDENFAGELNNVVADVHFRLQMVVRIGEAIKSYK